LLAHSASLRQAFEAMLLFQSLLSDDPSFELAEHGDQVTLRCFSPLGQSSRIRRFWAEMMVTGAFRLIRTFDSRALPERVSFEHAAPPYAAEYKRIFEGTQRFEEPFAGIAFDRALFEVRSPYKDEGLHRAMRRVAETRKLRLRQGAPYGQRVREFLVQERCPRWIDMDTVARALGLSARSLRRRLASEGTSYKTLESDALAIVAKQLLQDERLSIRETAREMGFSETTAFYRAFKRWTGTTPGAYRA
jgi:AraC-like DNA-binding protein